jgi:hypothetical protein
METPEGSEDNQMPSHDFPPEILNVPAPRNFIKDYKLGNMPVTDALIPANLPAEAVQLIGRGLRFAGPAKPNDFSGIHIAYATGQIPGYYLLPQV